MKLGVVNRQGRTVPVLHWLKENEMRIRQKYGLGVPRQRGVRIYRKAYSK